MTNALAEQLMRALPEGDDPLQRLKQLAQEMGIERPTRRTKRAFLRVAQQLGIESPAETHGSSAPMLDLPPAAEFVVRAQEKAWREAREEQLARAANRLRHSKVGLKVALAAQDQAAGARALRALAGFEIKPDDVGRDELAFAASLTDQQLERLMGKDAALLPAPEALERGFQATRGRARIILMGNVKRQSLDGDSAQLRYEVNGLELSENVARELLGDYSPMVARRAATEALGLSREVTGATLHLLGPRLDPDELLDGLGEWVREGGLVLILDASQADTDEIEALAPLLRDFSTERSIYTVLFLPALDAVTQEEGGNDVGRAGYPRTGDRAACGAQAQAALPDTVGAEAAGRGAEAGERVQRRERRNYAETPSLPAWQRDALPARQPWAAQGHAQQGEPRDE
jgi:hypothetical protein